jgi:predicted transcriptional regulator YdeE
MDTPETPLRRKQIDAFTVVGISARTNNAREAGTEGAIPQIWHRLVQEGLDRKIPNSVGQEVYGVYTDYASDHNGDYTFVAGKAVTAGTVPPEGMLAVTIPAGRHIVCSQPRRGRSRMSFLGLGRRSSNWKPVEHCIAPITPISSFTTSVR